MKTDVDKMLKNVEAVLAMDLPAAAALKLMQVAEGLREQIRRECAVAMGSTNELKVIERLLKAAKQANKYSMRMHYQWQDKEGRQCVCDGYRAFRLENHLPLEERAADAGEPVDLDKIYPSNLSGYKVKKLPTIKELKMLIRMQRAKADYSSKTGCLYFFGAGEPAVNAQYLVDLLTVLLDAEEIYYKSAVSVMYVSAGKSDAIVLPVRTTLNTAEKYNE